MADDPTPTGWGASDWAALAPLWERATGGSDVAARPDGDDDGRFPVARRAPGVAEAAAWLQKGIDTGRPRLLFLVGGPGAGKSHAARAMVAGLMPLASHADGLAHRTYRYGTDAGLDVAVVNDATIGAAGGARGALGVDIACALDDGAHLIACVNRGILVEEKAALAESNSDKRSSALIAWLHGDPAPDDGLVVEPMELRGDSVLPAGVTYCRLCNLDPDDTPSIEVAAVFMDACSLLEVAPDDEPGPGELNCFVGLRPYLVTPFSDRGGIGTPAMPAAELFQGVLKGLGTPPPADLASEPISANVFALSNPVVRANVLSVLRACEIVGAKRFTFRELWGAFVRCIVGSAPDEMRPADLEHVVRSGSVAAAGDPLARFDALRELAALRFSQALFGVGDAAWAANPVLRLTHLVDPVCDATPGRLGGDGGGWATPIQDAFGGSASDTSPLASLLRELDPAADAFPHVVTGFDRALDAAFVAALTEVRKDRDREALSAWYGQYLTRLYALSNGIPAFYAEVDLWTRAWSVAPALPEQLRNALETLVLPQRHGTAGGGLVLPLLESRTAPILGRSEQARLAVRSTTAGLRSRCDGDAMRVELVEAGDVVTQIEFDFPLIREALACRGGMLGITEYTHDAAPRLERLRAARLKSANVDAAALCIVHGASETAIAVREA